MKVRRGRKAVSVLFVASIASAGIVLLTETAAQAATPTLTIPGRIYPTVGTIMDFSGNDPISGDNRAIQVSGLAEGSGGCDDSAGNDYSIIDCARIQMSLNSSKAGLLRIADNNAITDLDADPEVDVIVNDTGAVIEATDSHGLDSVLFNINGTEAQIQNTLAKLQFVPCSQQQGTIDPQDNEFEVECGLRTAPAPEPGPYEEKESEDGLLPTLSIQAINPSNPDPESESTDIMQVKIKVEGVNNAPILDVTTPTIDAAAGATTQVMDVLDVDDSDMCSNNLCPGAGYDPDPDVTHQEGDDEMMLVMWLPESNCGTFDPRGDTFFTDQGGATVPTVDDLIKQWTGLDLNDSFQAVAAQNIAAAVEASLSPEALAIDLTNQSSTSNVTAWAGMASIDDVKYTLGGIDYNAPADDSTCHLNVAVSDLGNNGAPILYAGSPSGPEEPFLGALSGDTVAYEEPNALGNSTSLTFNVKDGHPSVTIDQLAPGPLGSPAGPFKPSSFTITFGEAIDPTSFDTSDLTLTTSNAAVPGLGVLVPVTPGLLYSVPVTASGGDTTLKLQFTGVAYLAGHNGDAAYSNEAPTYSDNEIDWDETGPTVTIDQKDTQDDPTNASPVVFTVAFSDTISTAPIGFDSSDVDLSASTTGGSLVATVTQPSLIDLKTYEVSVTGMAGPGDVIASVNSGAIVDTALNPSDASTSTDNSVGFDNVGPDVTIDQAAGQSDPTGSSPIMFDVQFSDAVTDFATGDVTVGGTALPTAAVVTGSGTTYTVAVSGMTQSGTVTASISGGVANDASNNPNTASTTGDDTVTFNFPAGDVTPPDVTINQGAAQSDPTSTSPIVFDVVFSEPVPDFATGDVTLSGTAGATTATVTGSGTNYTVSVSGMTQDGTVIASIAAGVAHDAANNANTTSTTGDATVNWVQPDLTPPDVTINQALGQGDPDDVSPILFTVVFTESVSDFTTGDVTLSGTAGATTADVTGSGTDYTVTVSGMTQPGTVIASVNADVAHDAGTNGNTASTSSDNTVTWNPDVTSPDVTIDQAAGQLDPATGTPILFTVVFSEPVSNFTTGDVTLSGSAGATTALVSGSGATYTVAVSGMTLDGTVIASIAAGVATDAAANANTASTSTDNTVTFDFPNGDVTPPTVAIDQAGGQADPTSDLQILYTVVFSEPVPDFTTGDVTLGGTAGATNATVSGSGMTYTVTASGMASNGTVTVSIAQGVAHDAANLPNDASTSTDATVTFDTVAPTVTIDKKVGQADPTNASPIMFTVTFSEAVTNFATGDVTLTGTASPTTATVTPVSASVYDVAVTGMSGTGTVIANVLGSQAVDLAGIANTAAPSSAQVGFDNVAPTVAIDQAIGQSDPTSAPSINFTVIFSESVSNFVTGDVTLSGTAGATAADVTGSGTTYTVAVSGMTSSGTVIASLAAGVASDAVGNTSAASTSTDHTVTFNVPPDNVVPTVTVNQAAAQADPSTGASVLFTVVFSEAVGGFTAADIALSGTAGATTAVISGAGPTYTVTATGMTQSGTVIAAIPAGAVTDAALNANTASTSTDNTVTFTEPTIGVSTPGGNVQITVVSGGELTAASGAAPQVPPPNGVTFPFGQLSFTASSTPLGLVVFKITLPSPATDYYKLASGAWQQFTFDGETGAQISGNVITVTIRDNGRGDSDATPGIVTDPGAPAVPAQVPPTTPTTSPTPPTTPTTTPGALPPTGSSSPRTLMVALLLVGLGSALLATRRRTSRTGAG